MAPTILQAERGQVWVIVFVEKREGVSSECVVECNNDQDGCDQIVGLENGGS